MHTIHPTALPAVYSVAVIAEVLGVHPDTLIKEIKSGRIAASKVGRSWRITDEAVRAYLAGE
jgi:excisionase family DNA binding protein